jgi:asparagine synthase (glutamine-hydrolysing)
LLEQFGIEETLKRIKGMFAFAAWDVAHKRLILARDRAGEKPLFYGRLNGEFVFGSELKALLAYKDWTPEIDDDALKDFLSLSYIPQPKSVFKNIFKLPAGHYLVADSVRNSEYLYSYWNAREQFQYAKAAPFEGTFESAVETVDRKLRSIVQKQMISDVPLGAFLSGGLDSSTIVALMRQASKETRTFTMGFEDKRFD